MQILVVVANIQTRTLKAEVEKGSTGTVLERGSVGPKRRDSSRLKRVCNKIVLSVSAFTRSDRDIFLSLLVPRRKGIGLTFPNPDTENGLLFTEEAVRRRERSEGRRRLPREEFSFLCKVS